MTPVIKIEELETLLLRIIKKLKDNKLNQFSFNYDEYWVITADEWNKFDNEPKPAVGSLNDDINYLKNVLNDDMVISYLELERLASVLRAIGEQLTADVSK